MMYLYCVDARVKWYFGAGQIIMLTAYTHWQVTDNGQNELVFLLRIPLNQKHQVSIGRILIHIHPSFQSFVVSYFCK